MPLRFMKMQGAGNDYVYLDGFAQPLPEDLPELARRMADRHYGVGGDGLICILPPTAAGAHVRMRMFNNDGSESEMCGNGIRCVAKYAFDYGLARENPLRVETGRGVLSLELQLDGDGRVESATVDMGAPILKLDRIGVDTSALDGGAVSPAPRAQSAPRSRDHTWSRVDTTRGTACSVGEAVEPLAGVAPPTSALRCVGEHRYEIAMRRGPREVTFVSMGNPHAVLFVDELERIDLRSEGPEIERLPVFPRRMNVHFVQVLSPSEVRVLHWERGTGATLACGTGACAVCVAGALTGRTAREIVAHLPGGDLRLRWDAETNHVFKTGDAVEVFSGEWAG